MEPFCASEGCPTPRLDRALEVVNEIGEVLVVPIGCGRNSCRHCRRRNVQVTAAKMALNQEATDTPITHAILSTTRDWVSDERLREGWAQFARRVRKEVHPAARYAWFREWTTGRNDGIRRTHYHSTWALESDDQAADVARISNEVWGRVANAYSEKAHGWKRVWDAGGLARYIAGLIGHHLKEGQSPPEAYWRARRYGTSRGFYAIAIAELEARARAAVRDQRLVARLEHDLARVAPDGLPEDIFDEVLTERLERARQLPPPRVVRLR